MKRRIKGVSSVKPVQKSARRSNASYEKALKSFQEGYEIFPLLSPGLPPLPPNSDFVEHCHDLGDDEAAVVEEDVKAEDGSKKKVRSLKPSDTLRKVLADALRQKRFTMDVKIGPHQKKEATFVPGCLWDAIDDIAGPRKADVMVIGKMPWKPEIAAARVMRGQSSVLMREMVKDLGIKGAGKWYMTNLVKFMPPNWKTTLRANWVKDGMHLLHHELKIVQPKFILCLGSDASKAILGSHASVTAMEGVVEDFTYNVGMAPTHVGEEWERTAKVMTVVHPDRVIRDQSASRQLERGLTVFNKLVRGVDVSKPEEVDHRVIDNYEDLLGLLLEIENDDDKEDDLIAVDAEWHGEHPVNAGSYVRTIQLSWKPKHAAGIKFHDAGGEVTSGFMGKHGEIMPEAINLLKYFFNGNEVFRKKRVVGHFFNADLEWLVHMGIDIRESFSCPLHGFKIRSRKAIKSDEDLQLTRLYRSEGFSRGDLVPAWYRTKFEGGADTGLMAHAIEETASYKLETLAMRFTEAPRYDKDLDQWKTDYCKKRGMKSGDLEGYGECPDEVLLPYGIYDADVTLRLFYAFDVLLDEDHDGNCCREPFWESQIATPAVLEIHRTGMLVDKSRVDFLTNAFMTAKGSLESKLRAEVNWEDFNIRSTQHVKELLFGYKLNGRIDKETGEPVRIRPEGAKTLNLKPLFDTSQPPKPWMEIEMAGKEDQHSPSTGKQVLSILGRETADEEKAKVVNMIRDYRFLDQVLKTVLRPPIEDEATGEATRDDDGYMSYADGLASMCCDDGRVRTHIYQTKETGRWSSARPNLQNISKQRDPDYKRLLGDSYKYSLRSILKASPGHVLLEADYVGAELFGMAVMSGDANMISHAQRNQLPEDHPDFYDIHSNVACFAFRLDCPPTKSGLESIGKKHIRIVAKSVIFGIAYGRGAKAIAVAAKEQGINITQEDAQAVIDAIFSLYPALVPFFKECQDRATGNFLVKEPDTGLLDHPKANFLVNCYGRYRRFPQSGNDRSLAAEFERQAMNYPIQSMIASAMSRAIALIHDYKERQLKKGHNMFNFVLQIHDAILLEVPFKYVKHVCEYVLPRYMRDGVPIYPSTLDGFPTGDGPYTLGIEADVMNHWGEVLTYEEAIKAGLPTGTGGETGCIVNYSKPPGVPTAKQQRSVERATKKRKTRKLA